MICPTFYKKMQYRLVVLNSYSVHTRHTVHLKSSVYLGYRSQSYTGWSVQHSTGWWFCFSVCSQVIYGLLLADKMGPPIYHLPAQGRGLQWGALRAEQPLSLIFLLTGLEITKKNYLSARDVRFKKIKILPFRHNFCLSATIFTFPGKAERQ